MQDDGVQNDVGLDRAGVVGVSAAVRCMTALSTTPERQGVSEVGDTEPCMPALRTTLREKAGSPGLYNDVDGRGPERGFWRPGRGAASG